MVVRRQSLILWSSVLAALLASASCKKKQVSADSDLDAITGIDTDGQKKALALIAVQNHPDVSLESAAVSERAKGLIKMPLLALVECLPKNGMTAQEQMRRLETMSSMNNLFVNKVRRLFGYGAGDKYLLPDCEVLGDRFVTWPAFAHAAVRVGGIPTTKPEKEQLVAANAAYTTAQAFFLAIRGPYYFDARAGKGSDTLNRLVQMANSYSGYDAKRRDALVAWLKSGDAYYNPCHAASASEWYVREWRNKNFTCDRMESDNNVADYMVGSKDLPYATAKLMLMTAARAIHEELYSGSGSKENNLWDALTSTSDWSKLQGPAAAAGKYLSGRGGEGGSLGLTEDNPLDLTNDAGLIGQEILVAKVAVGEEFALNDAPNGTPVPVVSTAANPQYLRPLVSAFSGVMMAPRQQATYTDFGDGNIRQTVMPPTLQDPMVVFTNQPRERTMPNGQKMLISDMDYYKGLATMQSKATSDAERTAYGAEIEKLMAQDSLKFTGVHRSGANEYQGNGVRTYVHNQGALEQAYREGFLSRADAAAGNTITWQNTGTTGDGRSIDKLISGNPNKIFETYQVGSDQMAFKFQRPDGSTHMAFANQDQRARAAGYAVPDAASQQNLLATANGIQAEYFNQASKEALKVSELKSRVDNYGDVSGGSYWGRMGEYWNRMGTASQGSAALERRDTLQNQTAAYAQTYVDNMRGKISPDTAGYASLVDRSSQMNMFQSLQQANGLGTAQAKESFNSTWRDSAWGAAKDTYTTASNAVTSTDTYKAVSSAASSAWNTMGNYASSAWGAVSRGSGGSTGGASGGSTGSSGTGSSGGTSSGSSSGTSSTTGGGSSGGGGATGGFNATSGSAPPPPSNSSGFERSSF